MRAAPVAVIVDAVRTPLGVRNGGLSGWHAADLAAEVLAALARRNHLEPALVDEVIMGCASPVGDQGLNLGRHAVLGAGWPETVPATTLDRQGASSLQALVYAAQGIAAGAYQVVAAAGVDVVSTTPAGAWFTPGSRPFGPRVIERYAPSGGMIPPGLAAERICERWHLEREDLDGHAAESQRRAWRASEGGCFTAETVPVAGRRWDRERRHVVDLDAVVTTDEAIRGGSTVADLVQRKPTFVPGGRVTAANSAPAADGAAGLLVMSEDRSQRLGLEPLARVVGAAGAGVDPLTMLTGVVPATTNVLTATGHTIDDIDRFEVDEVFAAVTLAWLAEHRADPVRVGVNGGSIALGHPPGCAGARMLVTLVHELARSSSRLGLATMGGVGGVATAVVVERR
ncbi:MAG: thiolase family protein [Acidimicrobiales bacterium]